MENTNDKMAAKRYDMTTEYNKYACVDQVEAVTSATGEWVKYDDHLAALEARAEEARREGEALGRASMREHIETVVRERDRAWQRTHHLQEQILAAAQRTAGGDAVAWECADLITGQIDVIRDGPHAEARAKVTHDGGKPCWTVRPLGYIEAQPVAEAAAQADDDKWSAQAVLLYQVMGSEAISEEAFVRYLRKMPYAAPTAQPTPAKTVEFDGIKAQPTPPDDELIRGFDRSLASVDAHDPQSFIDGAKWAEQKIRAALRQPGAPAKPLTRRDINFVKQPPGVIALTLAILWHDGAERPLYTRDDQIAWTGIDAGGHEKSVTVGQLREVLVAALGLPVGTKFGG